MSSGNRHRPTNSQGLPMRKKSRGEKAPMEAHPSGRGQASAFDSEIVLVCRLFSLVVATVCGGRFYPQMMKSVMWRQLWAHHGRR